MPPISEVYSVESLIRSRSGDSITDGYPTREVSKGAFTPAGLSLTLPVRSHGELLIKSGF